VGVSTLYQFSGFFAQCPIEKETCMRLFKLLPLLAVSVASIQAQAQNREVNIICSAQAAWCSMIAITDPS